MSFGLVSGSTDLLFSSVDWHRLEEAQRSALAREIDGYSTTIKMRYQEIVVT